MFLTTTNAGYNRNGEQFAHGYFLVLASPNGSDHLKLHARVVYVRYTQCGHFMMGQATFSRGGPKHTLSGPFGNDDLPLDYDKFEARDKQTFEEVPEDIADMYWHGKERRIESLLDYGKDLLARKKG